jgi:hypothetical protein
VKTNINPSLEPLLQPISDLIPDPENARRHGEKSILAIMQSLNEYRQQKPILVWKNIVIAGNGMFESAKRLGWTHMAVLHYDGKTKAEAVAFALADNRTAEFSTWDEEALANSLNFLKTEAYPMEKLSQQWGEADMNRILLPASEPGDSPNPPRTEQVPVIQYNIIFDDVAQRDEFYEFVKWAKQKYANEETFAARLVRYLKESNYRSL